MSSEKKRTLLTIFLAFLLIPNVIYANMIWPSVFVLERTHSIHVIIIGFLIEGLFVKYFLKESLGKSFIISFIMNLVSTVLGIIFIPFSGIIAEFVLFWEATFDILHWIASYILAIIVNVLLEGMTLEWIYKKKFKETYKCLFIVNAISVIICLIIPFESSLG